MAEADTEEPQELVNAEARRQVIRDGFANVLDLEQQIAVLTEKHIKPLKDKKTKAWRTLKADTNIPRREMRPAFDQYKLVAEALADDGDDVDADLVMDNCREIHAALGIGESVDWVKLLNGGYDG